MSQDGKTSAWIAEKVGGVLVGSADIQVRGVASLLDASAQDVSFLGDPKYQDRVLPSQASVVLVPAAFAEEFPPPEARAWVVCADPAKAMGAIVEAFAPPPVDYPPGIHPSAVVDESARLGDSVHVGPHAVIEADVEIGSGSVIGAGCFIGRETRIGENCLLYPQVVIRERCLLGRRLIIHPGVVIGADGFGFTPGPEGHQKIPQTGIVQIDDDVEIGAQTTIDRARFGRTWIQEGTKIDNLVMIAHNVVIGRHCFIVSQVGISGSCHIGHGVILAGQAGLAGHLDIGDRAVVMAKAGLSKDVPAGAAWVGIPAMDRRDFARNMMSLKRVERLRRTVQELQKELADVKNALERT